MRYSFKCLTISVLLFFLAGCDNAPKEKPASEWVGRLRVIPAKQIYIDLEGKTIQRKAKQIDSVFSKLQQLTAFNGTVLYAEKGRVVYEKAFGFENPVKKKHALKTDSRFELASVSKMFTATAIMILEEKGRLSYDVDIRMYIHEWPYEGNTIRQLLTHRSGIPRYELLADMHWENKNIPLTNESMIQLFTRYKPALYFKPDGGFHYCNTNYALLATIIERVSKTDFDVFMKKYVFEPAKMTHSFIYRMPENADLTGYIEQGVPGYDQRGRYLTMVKNDYLNGVMGDKIMYSTVGDLYRFEVALSNGILVSKSKLKEAFTPGSPNKRNRRDNYGFGWRIKAESDSAVYHYGWWKGFRTYFLRDMKEQKTLIVLTNKSKGPGSEHYWKLLNDTRIKFAPASVNYRYELDPRD